MHDEHNLARAIDALTFEISKTRVLIQAVTRLDLAQAEERIIAAIDRGGTDELTPEVRDAIAASLQRATVTVAKAQLMATSLAKLASDNAPPVA